MHGLDLLQSDFECETRKAAGSLRPALANDPLEGANCDLCGATADNFHVSDNLWERVGLGHVQACFKCFRIAAWHVGVRPDPAWQVSIIEEFWLLRLRDNRLSWHSYKDEATREKWAAKYRARGDRVSYDGFIRG